MNFVFKRLNFLTDLIDYPPPLSISLNLHCAFVGTASGLSTKYISYTHIPIIDKGLAGDVPECHPFFCESFNITPLWFGRQKSNVLVLFGQGVVTKCKSFSKPTRNSDVESNHDQSSSLRLLLSFLFIASYNILITSTTQ